MPSPNTTSRHAIVLKILSGLMFVVMAAQAKLLSESYALSQIVFFRLAASLPLLIACSWWAGSLPRDMRPTRPMLHVGRAVLGLASTVGNLTAVVYLNVFEAQAISFLTPIAAMLLSGVVLQERASKIGWLAAVVGLAGVWLMLGCLPLVSLSRTEALGASAGLAAVMFAASSSLLIRSLTRHDTTLSITISSAAIGAVVLLIFAAAQWRVPTWLDLAQLCGLGLVGGIAQLSYVASLSRASPANLAPFEYISVVWAMMLGVLLFEENVTPTEGLGIFLIILAGYAAARTMGR